MIRKIIATTAVILGVWLQLPLNAAAAGTETVKLWGRWTARFTATVPAPPELALSVKLTAPSGRMHEVEAFWDGESTWRVRFMPDEEGRWRFATKSLPAIEGLSGQAGEFLCARPKGKRTAFELHGPVRVSPDGRRLEHADGAPFFWLGDTVWNGALLSTASDWSRFLRERSAKHFTAVQFVMTSPWRTAPTSAEGLTAFSGTDPISIDPRFFDRIDARIDAINEAGMLAVPVMLWAIRGNDNPGSFLAESQAVRLARYLVARYGAHHLVWILAGDATYTGEIAERWKRIGRAVFSDRPHAPVTLHPGGVQWPWNAFREEKWLDLLGYQSGHGDDANALRWIHSGPPAQEWKNPPPRPVINMEPPYEGHIAYHSKQPHSAYSVRRAAWWSLLNAPPAGLTYGAHGIWSWQTEAGVPLNHANSGTARPWFEAMHMAGSAHMKVLADFFASIRWWELQPDDRLLARQPGGEDPARHVSAAGSAAGDLAVLYLPAGDEVTLRAVPRNARAQWLDPRTGKRSAARAVSAGTFRAPDSQDWVLIIKTPH